MKKKIFNLLFASIMIIYSKGSFAQTKILINKQTIALQESTGIVRDSLIDKFVGTWVYNYDQIIFKLVLVKVETKLGAKNSKIRVEQLNGGYLLLKNSKEVANTLLKKPL
jgi:hypothetical protein